MRELLSIEVDEIEATVPIIPVIVGADQQALVASNHLRKAGFYVPAIRPPTVPDGTARLRISLSAAHDESMLASAESGPVTVLAGDDAEVELTLEAAGKLELPPWMRK